MKSQILERKGARSHTIHEKKRKYMAKNQKVGKKSAKPQLEKRSFLPQKYPGDWEERSSMEPSGCC